MIKKSVALAAGLLLPVAATGETPRASPETLKAHVQALVSRAPRDYTAFQGLDASAAYIRQALAAAGVAAEEQVFDVPARTPGERLGPYRNIVARFGPDTKERLVIGAHYDVAGPYPGADDNASGVAALLELARLLKHHPPALRTELVAFTLEEPPFFGSPSMGSAVHAAKVRAEGGSIQAMVALECIGYFTDAPKSQRYPMPAMRLLYPARGNFVSVVGRFSDRSLCRRVASALRAVDRRVRWTMAPAFVPGVDFSDHRNYWGAGERAIMITDTAFYRNARYHTADDTPETLDYARMALITDGVLAFIANERPSSKKFK